MRPEIRSLYPVVSRQKRGQDGHLDNTYIRPLPDAPTTALPGTLAKIEVMEARYKKKQQLHHPRDARFSDKERGAA